MTTPAQDRDIRAALSRPKRTEAELEAAARRLLASCLRRDADYIHDSGAEIVAGGDAWWWNTELETCEDKPSAFAAAIDLLKAHPELWPEEPAGTTPEPDPLREALGAMREALEWLESANHGDDGTLHHRCHVCEERWPCDVEQARRRLAAALEDR